MDNAFPNLQLSEIHHWKIDLIWGDNQGRWENILRQLVDPSSLMIFRARFPVIAG
jgi:hypothetical protein